MHSKSRSVVVITIITISKAILKAQEIVYMIFGTWHKPPISPYYYYHDQQQWVIIGIDRKLVKSSNKTHDPRFWSILESRHIHSKSCSVVVITIITISKAILKAQEIVYMIFGTWHKPPISPYYYSYYYSYYFLVSQG